jgi:hypothetical protein
MTMSSLLAAPRKSHLENLERVYCYLSKMHHAAIRIRTEETNFSDLPDIKHDWARSFYGEVNEIIPDDILEPIGNMSLRRIMLMLT